MRTRLVVPILVMTLLASSGALAIAAGPYPNPPPDFAHPGTPHLTMFPGTTTPNPAVPPFSPASGLTRNHPTGQRRLLVIYVRFSDYSNQVSESEITKRFFPDGTFGTVSDYFSRVSGNKFLIRPAEETYGVAIDGLVTVDLGSSADFNAKSAADQNGTILNAVDPFVDFAYYDGVAGGGNGDGTVDWEELAVFWMATSQPQPDPTKKENCGKTSGIPDNKELDGKKLVFRMADARTLTNTMTLAHEFGHQALNVDDFYLIGMGPYALGASTCSDNQNLYFYPNAYERLHWGWVASLAPRVVVKDGYYTLFNTKFGGPAADAFMLYDPEQGTDNYFIVEYRQQRDNTYDWSIADSGLFIWRVLDSAWPVSQLKPRTIDLMRPDRAKVPDKYDGSNVDAWDPSDPNTPQRTMVRSWDDPGPPARVAVRAIQQAQVSSIQNTITAYFDVRGPGVLVDPTTTTGALIRTGVAIGGTVNIPFAVMNTGEATDTFDFTILVPTGWSATTQRMTLTAGQAAIATIAVTASGTATAGAIHRLFARGRSTTDSDVSTEMDFLIDVVKRPVSLEYTGDTTAEYSDPATLSARLTDVLSGQPLAGRTVNFELVTQTASAVTDANGVATATIVVDLATNSVLVRATVAPTATHGGNDVTQLFLIDEEDLTLAITSPLIQPLAGSASVAVQATEEADGSPGDLTRAKLRVVLQPTLTTTPYTQQATLDSTGAATLTFAGLPSDLWSVSVTVVSEFFEAPPLAAELVVFDPAAMIGGFASGLDQSGERVKLTPVVSYAGNTATGTVEMQSKPNKFKTTEVRWVVVADGRALVEALGEYNDAPAVMRADIRDSGLPGGEHDEFVLRIATPAGALLYQSGSVQRDNGNIVVSGTR